jgi:hypothetical protein
MEAARGQWGGGAAEQGATKMARRSIVSRVGRCRRAAADDGMVSHSAAHTGMRWQGCAARWLRWRAPLRPARPPAHTPEAPASLSVAARRRCEFRTPHGPVFRKSLLRESSTASAVARARKTRNRLAGWLSDVYAAHAVSAEE